MSCCCINNLYGLFIFQNCWKLILDLTIMEDGFAKTGDEVLKFFGTDESLGLTPEQIKTNQAKYGLNGK